ncbi:MAG: hypothetical protein A3B47_00875 [Candidatus Levybacteria bacterium RIFCSPLOWO2_01_FULL_39_24]|nr:MAG: hypothetical protein A2800_02905 [Candidatus Levybacteria bacterium RIFCSPHIGHO2_01_FULL_40_16]OGH27877.1 MAG: hypothetical protein A3E12_00975 [Candidatus Levybacteria bacterium RIFCSPHIGHO2_12_FULL_39_9]OGH45934.1 MAG: hypothetical protein A3B47_00875 [Candidatus Levybacteria bacterium RIFCSPLOWO2_01_FULL_39_24]
MALENGNQVELEAKNEWLKKLSNFIVIANGKTWAADGAEVAPRRPGYKRLQWPYPDEKMTDQDRRDYKGWEDWRLEDEYSGYFRAPGTTTIYYKGVPAWIMSYGGHGQTDGYEDQAKQTFIFLRSALMKVTSKLPFRGPEKHEDGDKKYTFKIDGDIEDGSWKEEITEDGIATFRQTGFVGLVINKDQNKKPILPWKLKSP